MTTSTFQQRDSGVMSYPTSGWLRFAFKAPIVLWRLGLGPLLGKVLMLITHTGRVSGLPRRTMVEYHTFNGVKYAPCAFGERAQWYQNIQADPLVTIQTATGAESMRARRATDDDELWAVMEYIRTRNPVLLDLYLETLSVQPTREDVLAKKDRIIFLAFEPTDAPTPPPLEADLKWVWWVVLTMIGLWLLRPRRRAART